MSRSLIDPPVGVEVGTGTSVMNQRFEPTRSAPSPIRAYRYCPGGGASCAVAAARACSRRPSATALRLLAAHRAHERDRARAGHEDRVAQALGEQRGVLVVDRRAHDLGVGGHERVDVGALLELEEHAVRLAAVGHGRHGRRRTGRRRSCRRPENTFEGATTGSAGPRVPSCGMSSNVVRMMAFPAGLRTGEDTPRWDTALRFRGSDRMTPMSSGLGAAVVGTGFGVITHARALDAAGIEVRALVGRDPDKTATACRALRDPARDDRSGRGVRARRHRRRRGHHTTAHARRDRPRRGRGREARAVREAVRA